MENIGNDIREKHPMSPVPASDFPNTKPTSPVTGKVTSEPSPVSPPSPKPSHLLSQSTSSIDSSTQTRAHPFRAKAWIRCIGCRIAAGGGRNCTKCGTNAYLSQKHLFDENGTNITGLNRVHSSWITPEILAMQRPHEDTLPDLIHQFKQVGITAVFNLTEPGEHPFCGHSLHADSGFSYSPEVLMAAGIKHFNWNWPDMTAPSVAMLQDIVQIARHELDAGGKIAIHCHAGYGRTGTVVACLLLQRPMTKERYTQLNQHIAATDSSVNLEIESRICVHPVSSWNDGQQTPPMLDEGSIPTGEAAATGRSGETNFAANATTSNAIAGTKKLMGNHHKWLHYEEIAYLTADEAIQIVRKRRPGSLQTRAQVAMVRQYEQYTKAMREVFNDASTDGMIVPASQVSALLTADTLSSSPADIGTPTKQVTTPSKAAQNMANSPCMPSPTCDSASPVKYGACRSPAKTFQQSVRDQMFFLSAVELQASKYCLPSENSGRPDAVRYPVSDIKMSVTYVVDPQTYNWTLKYVSKAVLLPMRTLRAWAAPEDMRRIVAKEELSQHDAELLVHLKRLCNSGNWNLLEEMCESHGENDNMSAQSVIAVLVQMIFDWIDSRADVLLGPKIINELIPLVHLAGTSKEQLNASLINALNKPQLYLLSELVGFISLFCVNQNEDPDADAALIRACLLRIARVLTRATSTTSPSPIKGKLALSTVEANDQMQAGEAHDTAATVVPFLQLLMQHGWSMIVGMVKRSKVAYAD